MGDLAVAGGFVKGAEAEQRLEAGERGAAAIVAEDELVEVDVEVLWRDAVVGALQPGLGLLPGRALTVLGVRTGSEPSP